MSLEPARELTVTNQVKAIPLSIDVASPVIIMRRGVASVTIVTLMILTELGSAAATGSTASSGYVSPEFYSAINNTSKSYSELAGSTYTPPAYPVWPISANWYTFEYNSQRSGYNPNETILARSNAHDLRLLWSTNVSSNGVYGPITASMILVNGTIYVGSWNGRLYALNASTGSPEWNLTLTNATPQIGGCINRGGIFSTPTYWKGWVYEMAGENKFWGINASNPGQNWSINTDGYVNVTNSSFRLLWSSPLIYDGSAYVGLASACDNYMHTGNSLLPGQLLKIPLSGTNHTPVAWFDVTHGTLNSAGNDWNDSGGSIWSTPSVDRGTNTIWITTGNENDKARTQAEYARSIIGLNATTLRPIATRRFGSLGQDQDFGAGATLFSNKTGVPWVGALNKNGSFYAFDQANLTSLNSSWTFAVANMGPYPGEGPSISPASWNGSSLIITGGESHCGRTGYPANATISRVDPSSGASNDSSHGLWQSCLNPIVHSGTPSGAESLGGTAVTNGLVVDSSDTIGLCSVWHPGTYNWGVCSGLDVWNGTLEVRNSSNGSQVLYHVPLDRPAASEPIVSNGRIYVAVGNFEPNATYVRGAIDAFGGAGPNLTVALAGNAVPVYGTPPTWHLNLWGNISGGAPGYACTWYWGDGSSSSGCSSGAAAETHTYPNVAGEFLGNLTVIDTQGERIVIQFQAVLGNHPSSLISGFLTLDCGGIQVSGLDGGSGVCSSIIAGDNIASFSMETGGTAPYSWSWNFGDGSALNTLANPDHLYVGAGSYLIALTVTDSKGVKGVSSNFITVPCT
jgi:outer membrane protein assembly factor BamB